VVKVTQSIIFGKRRTVETQAASLKRADGNEGQINTAYIERDNLTLRQELGRLTRKTLGFSKNRRELQHALDFIDARDNFVKPHGALRWRAASEGGSSLDTSGPCHGSRHKRSSLELRRMVVLQKIIINIL
jgi:hypothetical protein